MAVRASISADVMGRRKLEVVLLQRIAIVKCHPSFGPSPESAAAVTICVPGNAA